MATYLVTGATRGIGAEFVRQLIARGDKVLAGARREGATWPRGVEEMRLDVANPLSVDGLAKALHGRAIDVLINNAGVTSEVKTIEELEFEELERVLHINAVAPMEVTRVVLPNLRAGSHKKIINISSVMGSLKDAASKPDARSYAYRASKACLNMLTVCLANELRPEGFTCVPMHPGWVQTDMGGKDAAIKAEESVSGMLRVIDSLTVERTGMFVDYTGRKVEW